MSKIKFYNPMRRSSMNEGEKYFYILPLFAIVGRLSRIEFCMGWLFFMVIYTVKLNES